MGQVGKEMIPAWETLLVSYIEMQGVRRWLHVASLCLYTVSFLQSVLSEARAHW